MKKISITGIIILISISPLFRGLYFNFETYAFLAALALLSIAYFFAKMMKAEPVQISKWFMVAGILLIAAVVLSFATALNTRENLENILQYTQYIIAFIVLYDYFYDSKQLFIPAIMMPVVMAGFVCAVTGLIALTGDFNIWSITVSWGRIGATFQYANTASIYFAICFLFALTLANAVKSILFRSLLSGAGSILLLALFLTGSRGGYLIGIGAIFVFLLIQPSEHRIKGFINFIYMLAPVLAVLKGFNMSTAAHDNLAAAEWLAICFVLAAVVSLLTFLLANFINKYNSIKMPKGSGLIFTAVIGAIVIFAFVFRSSLFAVLPSSIGSRLARFSFNDINVLYRLEYDKDALKLLAGNWLLGLGGGGWKALYQSVQDYFYTAVFVHNNYLQVFVESGILGFLSYIGLVVAGVISAVYSYVKAADKVMKIYAGGLLCGLLALVVHSSFDFDLSFVSMALLLWSMFAAAAVGQRKLAVDGGSFKIVLIVVCSILFSFNAVYFAGAYNENEALKYAQSGEYKAAMAYYEEAYRLDPRNPAYAFELSKLYNYFADKSTSAEKKERWLEKARTAGEMSVGGNKYYPAYMSSLVLTYLASDMPLQALEYAEKLAVYQKYNGGIYELLARSCLAAAELYEKEGNTGKAREMLEKCIEINNNPYLLKSNITRPVNAVPKVEIPAYKHSEKLSAYLEEASETLTKLGN